MIDHASATGYECAEVACWPQGKAERRYAGYQAAGSPEHAEKFGVDDFAAAFVRLEGGIILDFRISWAMHMDTCGAPTVSSSEI